MAKKDNPETESEVNEEELEENYTGPFKSYT